MPILKKAERAIDDTKNVLNASVVIAAVALVVAAVAVVIAVRKV